MKISFTELWRTSGTVDRGTYTLIGVLGFVLKHNLDRLVATLGFHRPWGIFNYWVPVRDVARITQLRGNEAAFLGTLVALSLPFVWLGVALTMKRLRAVKLPLSLVALFFVPFLNLLFFLLLCLLPSRDSRQASGKPKPSYLAHIIPKDPLSSAAFSLFITVPIGFGMALLGARVLTNYGWGLFIALPFAVGFAAVVIYEFHEPQSIGSSIGVACLATTLLGLALLALAFEGAFCLVMLIPLAMPLSIMGGVCAHGLLDWQRNRHDAASAFLGVLLVFVQGVQWAEHMIAAPPSVYVVHTSIAVQAPPEKVWQQVVAFSKIPPPTEWLFRAGIAYPMQATMIGSGVGAERHCVFSTGAFVEPIQIWDEPHQLKFSVTSNPAPMEEWTPYHHIEPPHLHGFLVSEGGQFLLTPLPNGGTRLEGTTWYQHGLWPTAYWRLWSDNIIHRIHLRVLRHIRDEVENQTQAKQETLLVAPSNVHTSRY